MTDVSRLKKSRSANKNATNALVNKAGDVMKEPYNDEVRLDLEVLLKTIRAKEALLLQLDDEIVNLLDEEKIEEDIEASTNYGLKLTKNIVRIEEYIEAKKPKPVVAAPVREVRDLVPSKIGVKLPKIAVKKFNGDPTAWVQFKEIFVETVHKKEGLSAVEKFSYLKGYLSGPAEKCIEGISLTNENYGK